MLAWLAMIALCFAAGRYAAGRCFGAEEALEDRLVLWLATATALYLGVPLWLGIVTGSISPAVRLSAMSVLVVALAGRRWSQPSWLLELFGRFRRAGRGTRAVWVVAGLWWMATVTPGWFLPVRAIDAADYHVQQAVSMLGEGQFTLAVLKPEDSGQPYEYLETYANFKIMHVVQIAQARGDLKGAGLIQGWFLGVWVLTVAALGRRLAVPAWGTGLGALFLLTMPDNMLEATELYGDIQAACGVSLVLWGLTGMRWDNAPDRWLPACALAFLHVSGSKSSMLAAGGLLGVGGLVIAWRARVGPERRRLVLGLMAAGVLGVALGAGPWLARNVRVYGNPIAPFAVNIGSWTIFPGSFSPGINKIMLWEGSQLKPPEAFFRGLLETTGVTHLGNRLGGYGPNMAALGLPALCALLVALRRGDTLRWRALICLGVVCWIGVPDAWWPRYALVLATIPALAFCWLVTRSPVGMRGAWMLVLGLSAAWNGARVVPAVLYWPRTPMAAAYPFVTGDAQPEVMGRLPGSLSVRDLLHDDMQAPGTMRVGYVAPADTNLRSQIFRSAMSDSTIPLRRNGDVQTAEERIEEVLASKATHVIAGWNSPLGHIAQGNPEAFDLLILDPPGAGEHGWGPAQRQREAVWAVQEPTP